MTEKENLRLLIVEDEITLANMYKIKFVKQGFDVEIAENGFEASVKIQNFKPNVVLLDIMMPDMNGFETLKVFRQNTSLDTKIIMFSNLDKKDDIEKALELGADDYMIKANVTPKEAVEKVMALLGEEITCPHCGKTFVHNN